MATKVFRGDAAEVAEVKTVTPANVGVGDIFTLAINGKTIAYTATVNTVANVTAGITALWNASVIPEFAEITAADANTAVTLTHNTPGVPFTVTGTTTDGNSSNTQTLTVNTTTAASGPSCANLAANWNPSVPANTDDIVFEHSDVDVLYNLDAFSSLVVNSVTVKKSFTGAIGLPKRNANDYNEYRPTYLAIGFNTANLNDGEGQGSGRVNISAAASNATVNVFDSGSALENGIPAILLTSLGAASIVNVWKGDVGIAYFAGETSNTATLQIGYVENQATDATVLCGSGALITSITKTGGTLELLSNFTTLTQSAGETTIGGAATANTVNINGGTVYDHSSGTFNTVNVLSGATYDLRRALSSKAATALNVYERGTVYDPHGKLANTTLTLVETTLFNSDGQPRTVVVLPTNIQLTI